MTKEPKTVFRIEDDVALQEIVRRLIAEVGEGNEVRAAEAMELSQATVNRLKRRALKTVSFDTASKLAEAAKRVGGQKLERRLSDAIVSRAAIQLLSDGYQTWCKERLNRFENLNVQTWGVNQEDRPKTATGELARFWRRHVLDAVLRKADEDSDTGSELKNFRQWMLDRHVDEPRAQVAITRVLEPLAESVLSAYVERGWGSLKSPEHLAFVKAGIAREKILLNRPHALDRARTVATGGVRTVANAKESAKRKRSASARQRGVD